MIARAFILILFAIFVGGCAGANGPSEIKVNPGQYAAAFDAARESLIGRRFNLERVDARAGVITSQAKTTAGLATPWDLEQSTLNQEVEDLFDSQQRRVRITFEVVGEESTPPEDFRTVKGPITARVEVVVERIHASGWRIEPTAVRYSSYAHDPALAGRDMYPTYAVPFSQDPRLASRIAHEIRGRLGTAPPAAN